MTAHPFKPRAYLKEGCPFSFKLWLFLVEAGLAGEIDVIRCNPESDAFARVKARLAEALGTSPIFPTVEIAPGRYESDSDGLIQHFAQAHGVDVASLPALAFYRETLLPQLIELHEAHH
jgi:glutathione S-transferase